MAKSFYESDNINPTNVISSMTSIKGDVTSEGDLRIDGKVDGTLNIKGRLVIGTSGLIKGNITCQNADIAGSVEGNIAVNELLSLQSNAVINGDITIGKLSIEPGATFSGKCNMNYVSPKKDIIESEIL